MTSAGRFVVGLLLLIAFVWTTPATAARLFTCGFEENNLLQTMWTNTVNTAPTIQTTTVHSGTYALTKVTGTQGEVYRQFSASLASGSLYTRFYFQMAGLPTFTRTMHYVTNTSASDTYRLRVTSGTGVLTLVNVAAGSTSFNGPTLLTNTWYRIEVRHLISETAGQIEVRVWSVDGDTETEMSGSPFGDGNFTGGDGSDADTVATNVQRWSWGSADGIWGADVFFDDIAFNDTSGAFQTSFPIGTGNIVLIEPASDASMGWEDETAGASITANVNDLPGTPDDVNYNKEDDTLNSVDQMNASASGLTNQTLVLLDVYARVGSTQTNPTTGRLKVWDHNGSLTNGPNVDFAVNGWRILSVGTTNEHQVFNLSGYTPGNLDSFDLGYENITDDATRARRVSAVWANVEYTAAGGAVAPPDRMLLGVGR